MTKASTLILLAITLHLTVACRSTAEAAGGPSLRIMPLGDSITRGKDGDGYRSSLAKLLSQRGTSFHFVGGENDGPWWASERAHEGHNGAVIGHLIATIDERLREHQPDVVLLMIGANDLEAELDLGEMPQRYQTLLDRIVRARPGVYILVSEITRIRIPKFDALARAFNPKIKAMAEAMSARGHHVTFVPMHEVVSLRELDAIDHPDFFGNQKIAARWMDHLTPMLSSR